MKLKIGLWLVPAAAVVIAGLILSRPQTKSNLSEKIKVATSFHPIAYLAREIGGQRVEVEKIIPDGADPHDFEPTAQQLIAAQGASVVAVLDKEFEPWTEAVEKRKIIFLAEELIRNGDPHVWLDPLNMAVMGKRLANKLTEIDPEGKKTYQQGLEKLVTSMDKLDTKMREGLKFCQNRRLVAEHGAFGYLAERYGLEHWPVAGSHEDQEPTAGRMFETIKIIKGMNPKTIFSVDAGDKKIISELAKETGAKIANLLSGEFADESGGDYQTLMEKNLQQLRQGLECR